MLTDETTFVKLDCEGAELALLGVENPDWRNVTANSHKLQLNVPLSYLSDIALQVRRLIIEYSFTKDRSVETFVASMDRLRQAGFFVAYAGISVT